MATTKHLGIKIPLPLHRQLVQAAEADRRSLAMQVLVLLEAGLAARKRSAR